MTVLKKPAKGFTLLEVLVALVVLGLSLITIFELFQGGLQSLFRSGQHTLAYLRAREKLEELTLEPRPAVGKREGLFEDGIKWETLVSLYPMPQIKDKEAEGQRDLMKMVQLTARVFIGRTNEDRLVELNTLRLVLPESQEIQQEEKQ